MKNRNEQLKIATSSSISTLCRGEPRSQLQCPLLKNRNEPLNRDSKFDIDKNIATNKRIATERPHIEKLQRTIKVATLSSILTQYRKEPKLATALLDTEKSQ